MTGNERLKRSALLWLAIVTSLLLPVRESFAQTSNYPCWGMGPWMMGGAWGWFGGIFTMLFWVLILVAVVLFIRWLVTAGGSRGQVTHGPELRNGPVESAMDILKKRYAKGEISKEQYESMKRDLE